jgi:hypothetical protein
LRKIQDLTFFLAGKAQKKLLSKSLMQSRTIRAQGLAERTLHILRTVIVAMLSLGGGQS